MNEQNSPLPTGSSPSPSYATPSSTPSSTPILDAIIANTPTKRLEYLRGKEGAINSLVQWAFLGGLGLWIFSHWAAINTSLDGFIEAWEKLAVIGGFSLATWLIFKVIGNKTFREAVDGAIDRQLFAIAKWLRTRGDKFREAEFNIDRLRKRKAEADEARARVYAAYDAVNKAAQMAEHTAQAAGESAAGLQQEIERRHSGGRTRAVSAKVAQIPDTQLEAAFERAKSTLRSNYQFFQQQGARRENLAKRCNMLAEVSRATGLKAEEMSERLQLAKQNYDLAFQEMAAMQASDDIVNSAEARNFEEAIDGINKETDFFAGRVQMLMDRLDPTVQSYRMNQAAGDIADEDFYRAWMKDTKVQVDPHLREQLLTASEKPVISGIESLLGNPAASSKPQVNRTRTGDLDDLLQ